MSKKNKGITITMTGEQLEKVISVAVKNALNEIANEKQENTIGNKDNETIEAPATFALIELIITLFLGAIISIALLFIIACIIFVIKNGFNLGILILFLVFLTLGIISGFSIREVHKTTKIEIINLVFNFAVGLSSLTVASIAAYFTYLSTK